MACFSHLRNCVVKDGRGGSSKKSYCGLFSNSGKKEWSKLLLAGNLRALKALQWFFLIILKPFWDHLSSIFDYKKGSNICKIVNSEVNFTVLFYLNRKTARFWRRKHNFFQIIRPLVSIKFLEAYTLKKHARWLRCVSLGSFNRDYSIQLPILRHSGLALINDCFEEN